MQWRRHGISFKTTRAMRPFTQRAFDGRPPKLSTGRAARRTARRRLGAPSGALATSASPARSRLVSRACQCRTGRFRTNARCATGLRSRPMTRPPRRLRPKPLRHLNCRHCRRGLLPHLQRRSHHHRHRLCHRPSLRILRAHRVYRRAHHLHLTRQWPVSSRSRAVTRIVATKGLCIEISSRR